jgi:hypothetical protein
VRRRAELVERVVAAREEATGGSDEDCAREWGEGRERRERGAVRTERCESGAVRVGRGSA